MVCLTSCVFRSIRFSGFARPHFGVRREGELYTRLQGGGKHGREDAQDGHKLGDNRSLGGFPGPWAPARALGAQGRAGPGRTVRRAYYSSGQALMGLPLFISWRKGACLGSPLGDPTGRPRTARRAPGPCLPAPTPIQRPGQHAGSAPNRKPSPTHPAEAVSRAGPVARAVKSLRGIVLTGSPAKRSLVPSHAFSINALSYREYSPHHRVLLSKWHVNGLNTACHNPEM